MPVRMLCLALAEISIGPSGGTSVCIGDWKSSPYFVDLTLRVEIAERADTEALDKRGSRSDGAVTFPVIGIGCR